MIYGPHLRGKIDGNSNAKQFSIFKLIRFQSHILHIQFVYQYGVCAIYAGQTSTPNGCDSHAVCITTAPLRIITSGAVTNRTSVIMIDRYKCLLGICYSVTIMHTLITERVYYPIILHAPASEGVGRCNGSTSLIRQFDGYRFVN